MKESTISFNEKRDEIYDNNFKPEILLNEGTKPHKVFSENIETFGGILLAYRLPKEISEDILMLGMRIKNILPGIITYDQSNTHVTAGDFMVSTDFKNLENKDAALKIIYNSLKHSNLKPVTISFEKWLANRDSVIGAGYVKNDSFVDNKYTIDSTVKESLEKETLEEIFNPEAFRTSVTQHTTAARFTEEYLPEDTAIEYVSFLVEYFKPNSDPIHLESLDIGTMTMNKEEGFKFETYEQIKLK